MKAAASTEFAAALGATVRAARQGADPRPGSENGNTAAASFDAVLNDVQAAKGNSTAAEPGAAKAVPATDDTAAELPQPNGGTDPASLSGTAANTATGADAASGAAPGTDVAPSGITSLVPATHVPAPYFPAPYFPAQYGTAEFPPAQFVPFAQLGQAGQVALPGQSAQAVAPPSDSNDGSRTAAPAVTASAASAVLPDEVPAAVAQTPAVATPGLAATRRQTVAAVPAGTMPDGKQNDAAASQTAGVVPLAGPKAAAGGPVNRPVNVNGPAPTAAPVDAVPTAPATDAASPVATVAAAPLASTATGAAGITPATGPVPVLSGPAKAAAPAGPTQEVPVQAAATPSAATAPSAAAAAQTAQGPGSGHGASPAATTAAVSARAVNGSDVAAVAASAPGQAPTSPTTSPGTAPSGTASSGSPGAGTGSSGSMSTGTGTGTVPAPFHAGVRAEPAAAPVPNAAQVPSNPEGARGELAAIPVQPTLAAATVAQSVAQAVPQPAAQSAAQPAFQSASPPAPHYAAPLQSQLAKPLFTLVGAPRGQHIMTLKVSPEDLGPLTVRAQIDAAGVRIELFAPGDAGREAVRGILPELRRELHGAGFGASLDLSDHNSPGFGQHGAQHGTGQDRTGTGGQFATG
ncbi:flagellar hook-length control protein FliK, partial [Arthrobacter sp. I3]|uniref:flagellar hook-length control protein FliK n=1 Tax=Arthrobacter sp. I3 TaxID=218158 RepID=UPI0005BB61D9